MIADGTAYSVRYTGKLWNRFQLQFLERLERTIRFNGQSLWTHPNSIYSNVNIECDRQKFSSSRSQWITQRRPNTTSARLIVIIVCLKKCTFAFSSTRFTGAFCDYTVRYILQQKCLNGQIETFLLGTRWCIHTYIQLLALYTVPESHNAQRYLQTDGRTDRRTDDMMMPIADHTV